MRIRKNLKSSLSHTHNSSLHTQNCQLNQSPWDTLDSSSNISPPPLHTHQVVGGSSFAGNGRFQESIGVLERVVLLNLNIYDEDYNDTNDEEEGNETIYCNITDAEGNLVCGRDAKKGSELCDFHLVHSKSSKNSVDDHGVSKKSGKKNKAKKSKKSKSNPYEIYYYSGFGPRWAKKRSGDKSAETTTKEEDSVASVDEPEVKTEAAAAEISNSSDDNASVNEEFNNLEDGYDEEDADENEISGETNGRKRRKPIKERSLKSLM